MFAVHLLSGLWSSPQPAKGFAGRHMREEVVYVVRRSPALMLSPMGRGRQVKGLAIPATNDEESLTVLRDAVIGGIKHLVGH